MRNRIRTWFLGLVLGLVLAAFAAPLARARSVHAGGPPARDGEAFKEAGNPSSFGWSDAAVLAGAGLVLLAFGSVQARRRTGQPATA